MNKQLQQSPNKLVKKHFVMDTPNRKDLRDMTREAQFQTQLLTQQGNLNSFIFLSYLHLVSFNCMLSINKLLHFDETKWKINK